MPNILIKIQQDKNPNKRKEWSRHIQWLMRQHLDDLNIARPVEIIAKPTKVNGYVMELMDGLESLSASLEKSHAALLENEEVPLDGYIATGGVKRRLQLLKELASTLAKLHSRGLAYGDLSPANIFVSESVEYHQLWLIDCDNICVSERSGHGHYYTPGFGAPEIIREESGVNMSTDSWSFAVIAFKLLTLCHPFTSSLIMEDAEEEEGGAEIVEEKASKGELPWIYDDEDDSNEWDGTFLPLELVSSKRIRTLFNRCFGEGRQNIAERPSMSEWADALDQACSLIQTCEHEGGCGSSFIYNRSQECPFCEDKQPPQNSLLMRYYFFNEETLPGEPVWIPTSSMQLINTDQNIELRLAPVGTELYRESPVLCTIELQADGLHIKPTDDGHVELQRKSDGKTHTITRKKKIEKQKANKVKNSPYIFVTKRRVVIPRIPFGHLSGRSCYETG